jgi:hypothetical protein
VYPQVFSTPKGRDVRAKILRASDRCRIPKCVNELFELRLCKRHWSLFKRGRIDLHGKLLPLTCRECSAEFFYASTRRRELCDACKPKTPRGTRTTRQKVSRQAARRRSEILQLRKQGATLGAIGRLYGVTRERIRQIIQANRASSKRP